MRQVTFTYRDFDGSVKEGEATIHEERTEFGTDFWAENLAKFGYGKRVNTAAVWHPIPAAIKLLIGGREVLSHQTKE